MSLKPSTQNKVDGVLWIQSILSYFSYLAYSHLDLDIFSNKGLGAEIIPSSDDLDKMPKTWSMSTKIKEEQKWSCAMGDKRNRRCDMLKLTCQQKWPNMNEINEMNTEERKPKLTPTVFTRIHFHHLHLQYVWTNEERATYEDRRIKIMVVHSAILIPMHCSYDLCTCFLLFELIIVFHSHHFTYNHCYNPFVPF